jgi:hypothetical protein
MSESLPPASNEPAAPVAESSAGAVFGPYENPAGGWGALGATALALREQSVVLKGSKALLSMNQPDGFDCPGCAWPDPKHTSFFEFCENGAKAVSFELTSRRVGREFRRLVRGFKVRPYNIPRGKTPSAKSIPVLIRPMAS